MYTTVIEYTTSVAVHIDRTAVDEIKTLLAIIPHNAPNTNITIPIKNELTLPILSLNKATTKVPKAENKNM